VGVGDLLWFSQSYLTVPVEIQHAVRIDLGTQWLIGRSGAACTEALRELAESKESNACAYN
jgi:hypothetical protein